VLFRSQAEAFESELIQLAAQVIQLEAEIQVRKNLLEAMKTQGILDYISVATVFHAYNIDPANVLSHITDLRQVIQ
jgi:hypothetical protein